VSRFGSFVQEPEADLGISSDKARYVNERDSGNGFWQTCGLQDERVQFNDAQLDLS